MSEDQGEIKTPRGFPALAKRDRRESGENASHLRGLALPLEDGLNVFRRFDGLNDFSPSFRARHGATVLPKLQRVASSRESAGSSESHQRPRSAGYDCVNNATVREGRV